MNWTNVTLNIHNIEPERGGLISVYIFLEEGFPIKHHKAIKYYSTEAKDKTQLLNITVPEVPFAIKIHHDEDSSGSVTKNWTGFIPAEGLGFSSGAKLGYGPPDFDDAVKTQCVLERVKDSIKSKAWENC